MGESSNHLRTIGRGPAKGSKIFHRQCKICWAEMPWWERCYRIMFVQSQGTGKGTQFMYCQDCFERVVEPILNNIIPEITPDLTEITP